MSVFNGERFLSRTLASIFSQTFASFELIVVDDASTDRTPEILSDCSDGRLRVLRVNANKGLVDGLNLAIDHAQGRYLARLDADDLSYPERLRRQFDRMEFDPRLVLLGCDFDYIDAHDRVFHTARLKHGDVELQQALQTEGNQFCHASVMMRTEAVRRVGGYRKLAGRYSQDYDLWLRLSQLGSIENLDEVLVGYRCHGEMLSIKKLPLQRRAAEVYKALAHQRKAGTPEDLAAAERTVDALGAGLKNAIAGDYLRWSDLYQRMGERQSSRQMFWKALRTAPLSPEVRDHINRALRWRLGARSPLRSSS